MSERDMRLDTLAQWLEDRDLPRGAKQAAQDIRDILSERRTPGPATAAMLDRLAEILDPLPGTKWKTWTTNLDIGMVFSFLREWGRLTESEKPS